MQEEIWSSSTSMEMGLKSTSKKIYGRAAEAWSWVKKSKERDIAKQHKHDLGLKSESKKRYGQAAQAWRWGYKAHARRDMVKQHKHADAD